MWHESRWWWGGVLAVLTWSATSCTLDVSYDGTRYACDVERASCPGGFRCGPGGFCEQVVRPADASVRADAEVLDDGGIVAADADVADDAASAPDARRADAALPQPDATPPLPDANTGPVTVVIVAARDTAINSNLRSANFGATTDLVCNGNPDVPVLFGWDVGGIPTNAIVDAAVLRVSTGGNALAGETASVFALLQDWTEGSGNGQDGVANYDTRQAGQAWATAGAKPPSRGGSAIATFAPTVANTTYDVALPKALVQGWVSAPATSFGVIVTCPFSNDVAFHSRAVGGLEPRLVVTYRVP
jgi:hypothetical protein